MPLTVVKSSGAVEPFDRAKVAQGLLAATKGRNISPEQIDQMVEAVEDTVRLGGSESTSAQIGAVVLNLLGRGRRGVLPPLRQRV